MSNRSVNKPTYYAPAGGHPPQTQLLSDRAVFTEAYAIIPRGVMRDIVASALPHWEKPGFGCFHARCLDSPKRSPSTSWRCPLGAAARDQSWTLARKGFCLWLKAR